MYSLYIRLNRPNVQVGVYDPREQVQIAEGKDLGWRAFLELRVWNRGAKGRIIVASRAAPQILGVPVEVASQVIVRMPSGVLGKLKDGNQ